MSDPLGLISGANNTNPLPLGNRAQSGQQNGPDFKAVLMENLNQVNALEQDATSATEDFMTGDRTDVEGVISAAKKAETAFKMLQAMRNQVMEAYEEVKQMRV